MTIPKFKTDWFYSSVGKFENVVTEGWFSKKVKRVVTEQPRTADYDEFAEWLAKTYIQFDADGYDVINVIPLNIGASQPVNAVLKNGEPNYLGEVGFSVTRGAIVVGKLKSV